MRRFVGLAVASMMVATLAVGTVAAGTGSFWKAPPFSSIGIYNFAVDSSFREAGSPSVLDIFVETGSPSPKCLVSLNEVAGSLSDIEMVFCASRNPDFGEGAIEGVFVHVFFFDDPGPDLYVALNVYQEGARFFEEPRYCSGDVGGC